jgi:EPS-associated MarR family transcriptional regulator
LTDEAHFHVLRLLAERPDASQRQLAVALGISFGKANCCIQALPQKGWVKANNFATNLNKGAYRYFLTTSGMQAKARLSARFLPRKLTEYEVPKPDGAFAPSGPFRNLGFVWAAAPAKTCGTG